MSKLDIDAHAEIVGRAETLITSILKIRDDALAGNYPALDNAALRQRQYQAQFRLLMSALEDALAGDES